MLAAQPSRTTASGAVVNGTVHDSIARRALPGVTVQFVAADSADSRGFAARTDSAGRYHLNDVPAGRYLAGSSIPVPTRWDSRRGRAWSSCPPESNGSISPRGRRRPSSERCVHRWSVRTPQGCSSATSVNRTSSSRSPARPSPPNGRRRSSKGFCTPSLYVDGNRDIGADFNRYQSDQIAGIEVYVREAWRPSEFLDGNTCGAVVIWTRPAPARKNP